MFGQRFEEPEVAIGKPFGALQVLHRASDALSNLWNHLLHQGEELVANLVAQRFVFGIGAVDDVTQAIVAQIIDDVLPAEAEEGTNDVFRFIPGHDAC